MKYWAFDEKDVDIIFKSAETARKFDSYAVAEKVCLVDRFYAKCVLTQPAYFMQVKWTKLGKFDKAIEYYDLYLSQYSHEKNTSPKKPKGKKASCTWAATNKARSRMKMFP